MKGHLSEAGVALFISGDLGFWRGFDARLHLARCESCRARVDAYRLDRERLKEEASEIPAGVHWERLAAEMAANIRVGLAAGECVTPRRQKTTPWGWKAAAVAAGMVVVMVAALWLNFPPEDKRVLGRAMTTLIHGRNGVVLDDLGPVVEASASGVELRENGNALGISQGTERPVGVSLNTEGSASARYVDADTGQVTITTVYAQ